MKGIFNQTLNSVIDPSPKKIKENKLTVHQDLAITFSIGLSEKKREKLKRLLGSNLDVFASTRQFRKEKKRHIGRSNYEYEDGTLFLSNMREVLAKRIQTMERSGLS